MAGNLDRAIDRLIALQDLLQLKRDLTDRSYGEIGFETVDASAVDVGIDRAHRITIHLRVVHRWDIEQ